MPHQLAETNKIYKVISGSHAYGTNIETSDIDFRGIYIMPKDRLYSPFYVTDEVEIPEVDGKLFELNKFIKLLCNANPNILELLFVPAHCHVFIHPIMKMLLRVRDRFLTKKIKTTFGGYATAQLRKLQKNSIPTQVRMYDTKNAMHLVRLLQMGEEALRTGVLNVQRENTKELLSIRAGNMDYAELIRYVEVLNQKLNRSFETSSLPDNVDIVFVEKLCIKMREEYYASI